MSCTVKKEKHIEPNWYWFLIIAVFGLALRLTELGKQSLWLDEMTSIQVALQPLEKILTGQAFDNFTPPLYYVLLHFWSRLVPLTEVTLRLPSAIIDFCNIFLLIALSRRFISKTATFLVVSAYAISPFMLYYSQEGRMYTLAVFFALAFCLALERVVRAEKHLIPWTFISGVLLALGVYTHYYLAFFAAGVMSLALFICRYSPKRILALLISGILGVLFFTPWIARVFELIHYSTETGGQSFRKFTFSVLPYSLFRFIVGYGVFPFDIHTKEHVTDEIIAHIPYLLLVFGNLMFLLYNMTTSLSKKKLHFVIALIWIVVTPAIIGLLISLKSPMLSERYLIVILPFFFLLLLGFIDKLKRTDKIGLSFFFILLIIGDISYFTNPQFGKPQWRDAAKYVSETIKENDIVVVEPAYSFPLFVYYFKKANPVYPSSVIRSAADTETQLSIVKDMLSQHGAVYLVSSGQNKFSNCGLRMVFERVAEKKAFKIFPLMTGITCTTWEPSD